MMIARKITTILAVAAFAGAFSLPIATSAEPHPAAAKVTTATAALPQERHPEIRDAMKLLADAQNHLKHASQDFGGHRVKAMQHIDEAMEELRAALASDKR